MQTNTDIQPVPGHCDYHRSDPVECEPAPGYEGFVKARFVVLRCAECGRSRGIRRISLAVKVSYIDRLVQANSPALRGRTAMSQQVS